MLTNLQTLAYTSLPVIPFPARFLKEENGYLSEFKILFAYVGNFLNELNCHVQFDLIARLAMYCAN